MQIKRLGYQVRGFWKLNDYAIRYTRMVTNEAQDRAKILAHWQIYGLASTLHAFRVSRRTLFRWKARRKKDLGRMESLNPSSRKPKRVRTRRWPIEIIRQIKILRHQHPNLGKEKIHVLLKPFCKRMSLTLPSITTIGRLISDDPLKMRTELRKPSCAGRRLIRKPKKKARKPKGFKAIQPGHCLAFDTVERTVQGCRRYLVTMTDLYSRFSFAFATTSHGSLVAMQFFKAIQAFFPYPIQNILTDNGSEFMKHFDAEIRKQCLFHWHTYPKTPKMNAHCERFNRTLQEEFVNYHSYLLKDTTAFNDKLVDYLIWFNTERPHKSLNLRSPIQFLTQEYSKECHMWWTRTDSDNH